eukprot:scaffold407_cov251-Pinguiococcus_pyrenoidosus.AAC.4
MRIGSRACFNAQGLRQRTFSLRGGCRHLGRDVYAFGLRDVHLLAESEIGELEVPVPVEKHVVGLEVAMDVVQGVHGGHGEAHLGHVDLGLVLGEGVFAHEERHEVAPGEELHHHVQVGLILEGVLQAHDPGIVRFRQDVSLGADVSDLILHHHGLLDHALERVDLLGVLLAHEADLSEGAAPDHHQGREGVRGQPPALFNAVRSDLPFELLDATAALVVRETHVLELLL